MKQTAKLVASLQACYPSGQNSTEAKLYFNAAKMALEEMPLEAVDRAIRKIIRGADGRGAGQAYLPKVPELMSLTRAEVEAINAERRKQRKNPLPGHWGYPDYINAAAGQYARERRDMGARIAQVRKHYPESLPADLQSDITEAARVICAENGWPLPPELTPSGWEGAYWTEEGYARQMRALQALPPSSLRRSMMDLLDRAKANSDRHREQDERIAAHRAAQQNNQKITGQEDLAGF